MSQLSYSKIYADNDAFQNLVNTLEPRNATQLATQTFIYTWLDTLTQVLVSTSQSDNNATGQRVREGNTSLDDP